MVRLQVEGWGIRSESKQQSQTLLDRRNCWHHILWSKIYEQQEMLELIVCDIPDSGHQRNSWPDSCYFMLRHLSKLDSVVTGNQHFLLSTTQSFFCSTDPFLNPDQGSPFSSLSLDKGFCWVPWSLTSLTLGATGRGPWTDLGLLWFLWTPRRTSIFISRSFICMPWILSYLYYFFHIHCFFPIPVTLLLPSSCSSSFRVFLRLSLNWYFSPQSSPPVTLRIVNCWIVRKFASWLISHG